MNSVFLVTEPQLWPCVKHETAESHSSIIIMRGEKRSYSLCLRGETVDYFETWQSEKFEDGTYQIWGRKDEKWLILNEIKV